MKSKLLEATLMIGLSIPVLALRADAQNELYRFLSDSQGDRLGALVSDAGDVNNDGFPDLIASMATSSPNGKLRVFSGQDGSILNTIVVGPGMVGSRETVSGAGDLDNDGFDDVIVGLSGDSTNGLNSGLARVYSGANWWTLHTFYENVGDPIGCNKPGMDHHPV